MGRLRLLHLGCDDRLRLLRRPDQPRANGEQLGISYEAWGIGASYDLGGGAAVRGGYADRSGNDNGDDGSSYDFGIVMTF